METRYFGVKVTSQKHCRRGSLHSCECWLLLVEEMICLAASFFVTNVAKRDLKSLSEAQDFSTFKSDAADYPILLRVGS